MRNSFLFLFLAILSLPVFAANVVRCGGKLYSLEYALIQGKSPINGNIFKEGSIGNGTLVLSTYLLGSLQRTYPYYNSWAASYINTLLNETDMNNAFVWKKSKLGFPTKIVSSAELPMDASCFTNGKATVYEVIKYSKLGSINLFEYDESLYAELAKSDVQKNFVNMANFFSLYVPDLKNRANLVGLLMTQEVIMVPNEILSSMVGAFGLNTPVLDGICNRSSLLLGVLERQLALTCDLIELTEIGKLKTLKLVGQGANRSLSPNDFLGFSSLQELQIENTIMGPASLDSKSFSSMKNLEKLVMTSNKLLEVPCQTFGYSPKLSVIDLSKNEINSYTRGAFCGVYQSVNGKSKTLDLSFNGTSITPRKTTYFYAGAFEGMGGLTHLLMKDMNLGEVGSGVFDDLSSLKSLDISDNFIRDPSFLMNTVSKTLVQLDLSGNLMKTFPAGYWASFPKLEVLVMNKMGLHELPDLKSAPQLKQLMFCNKFLKEQTPAWLKALKVAKPQLKITEC